MPFVNCMGKPVHRYAPEDVNLQTMSVRHNAKPTAIYPPINISLRCSIDTLPALFINGVPTVQTRVSLPDYLPSELPDTWYIVDSDTQVCITSNTGRTDFVCPHYILETNNENVVSCVQLVTIVFK